MKQSVAQSGSKHVSRSSKSQGSCSSCMMIRSWIMAIVQPSVVWGLLAMAAIAASSCIRCWRWLPEAAVSACSDYCIKKPGCATPLLARPMAAKRAADSDESGHGKARCGRERWSRRRRLRRERCGSMWQTGMPICLPFCSAVARWEPSSWCEQPRSHRSSVRSSRPSPNWIICSTGPHPGQPGARQHRSAQ